MTSNIGTTNHISELTSDCNEDRLSFTACLYIIQNYGCNSPFNDCHMETKLGLTS